MIVCSGSDICSALLGALLLVLDACLDLIALINSLKASVHVSVDA